MESKWCHVKEIKGHTAGKILMWKTHRIHDSTVTEAQIKQVRRTYICGTSPCICNYLERKNQTCTWLRWENCGLFRFWSERREEYSQKTNAQLTRSKWKCSNTININNFYIGLYLWWKIIICLFYFYLLFKPFHVCIYVALALLGNDKPMKVYSFLFLIFLVPFMIFLIKNCPHVWIDIKGAVRW